MSEVRFIDANAYAAEMKVRQDACKEIMDAAVKDDNWELYDKLSRSFGVFVEAKLTLDKMPTVDAVPVVRCKDCKHCYAEGFVNVRNVCEKHYDFWNVDDDWFCADGKEKSDGRV